MPRKTITSFCLILVALLCVSCKYSFDFKGLDGKGKIYVTCIYRGADTTVFDIRTTVPITEAPARPEPLTGSRAVLTADGAEVELMRSDGTVPGIAEGSFYTLEKFAPGDVLEFSASVDGLDDVTAVTQVPGRFPEVTVRSGLGMYDPGDYGESLLLTADFKDDPSSEDFYGVIVTSRTVYERNYDQSVEDDTFEDYESYPYVILPPDTEDNSSRDRVLNVTYDMRNSFTDSMSDIQMMLWDDTGFDGGMAHLELFLNYDPDWYCPMQTGRLECRKKYRLMLFKVSPEIYYAAKADYIYSHNSFKDFSSPAFMYSNVIGGIGYFGAMNESYSEWVDNPGEMVELEPLW